MRLTQALRRRYNAAIRRTTMSKALVHARSSARRWGGQPEDYLAIHEKMDSTKSAHAEVSHRCVFHSAFGIFIIEDIFGRTLTNSDGKEVFVRDVAEQHVLEDLGFIPSLSDWLREMPAQPWMAGAKKLPIRIVD
jgi:hypothetical protein